MDNEQNKDNQLSDEQASTKSRRDFLKKSKYAVYATPLMTSLIISSNAAHASCPEDPGCPRSPADSAPSSGGFGS